MNRIVFYLLVSFLGVTNTIAQGQLFREESDGFKWYSIWTDDNKYSGALDVCGNVIIPLYQYRYVSYNNDSGVFQVVINDEDLQNGKFGYCTRRGRKIVESGQVDQSFIVEIDKTKYIRVSKQGKYGAYSLEGKVIVPCEYDECDLFSLQVSSPRKGRLQYFYVNKGGRKGIYDLNGKLVIPVNYNDIRYNDWDDNYRGFEGKQGDDISYRKINISIPITYSVSEIRDMFNKAYNTQDIKIQYNLYNQIILNDPYNLAGLNSYVYNNLGALYETNSDLKKAKNCYQNAINIDPQNTTANENLKNVRNNIRKERLERVVNIFGYLSQSWGAGNNVRNVENSTNGWQNGNFNGSSGSSTSSFSSGNSSSSVYTKCTSCNGTGHCTSCKGRGYKFNSYAGHDDECPSCRGKGSCPICYGRGRL